MQISVVPHMCSAEKWESGSVYPLEAEIGQSQGVSVDTLLLLFQGYLESLVVKISVKVNYIGQMTGLSFS